MNKFDLVSAFGGGRVESVEAATELQKFLIEKLHSSQNIHRLQQLPRGIQSVKDSKQQSDELKAKINKLKQLKYEK